MFNSVAVSTRVIQKSKVQQIVAAWDHFSRQINYSDSKKKNCFNILTYIHCLLPPYPLTPSTHGTMQWSHTNHDKLLSLMSEADKKVFNFDIRDLSWKQYINVFCMGTKQYLLNEDVANLPIARKQIKR